MPLETTLLQYGIAGVVIAWLFRDNIVLRKDLKESQEARIAEIRQGKAAIEEITTRTVTTSENQAKVLGEMYKRLEAVQRSKK